MSKNIELNDIYYSIKDILESSRKNVFRNINSAMVKTYWNIGRIIVEEEQKGKDRDEYGDFLIKELSKRLTRDFGRGFDQRNIWFMRKFYLSFKNVNAVSSESGKTHSVRGESQKGHALRDELTWTHYRLL